MRHVSVLEALVLLPEPSRVALEAREVLSRIELAAVSGADGSRLTSLLGLSLDVRSHDGRGERGSEGRPEDGDERSSRPPTPDSAVAP